MQRRGEYGGGSSASSPVEVPKAVLENRQDKGGVNLEDLNQEEWETAQELHQTRGEVFSTLDAGMKNESLNFDELNADPKFWKIMTESLVTLGVPQEYVSQHIGKMEVLMHRAQDEGPSVLGNEQSYIGNAIAALKESIKYARNRELSLKASGNPTSTAWESLQLRHIVENDKFAAEKVRRGARGVQETSASTENTTVSSDDTNDTVIDMQSYREKAQPRGFTLPGLEENKRNPNYWKEVANALKTDPRMRGAAATVDRIIARINRGDSDAVLDAQIHTLFGDIDKKLAA